MVDQTETNKIEAVDMDIEYEDCSSELVAAADTDIACCDIEDSSNNKDAERPSEEVKLQLVDDTRLRKIENCSEGGQAKLVLHNPQDQDQIAGRLIECQTCMWVHFKSDSGRRIS